MSSEFRAEKIDSLKQEFGSRLERNLTLAKASREDLANYLGKGKTSVSKWFIGDSLPTPENFALTLEFLNPPEEEMKNLIDHWLELRSQSSKNSRYKHSRYV
jgi:transcriptional regulator with XRE-family HTH domain